MSSRPPPLGSIEPDMDIPSEVSDAGSKAGAQAVIKHLIGVDFPPDLNQKAARDAFSKSVAGGIFRTFAEVRGSLSKFASDADLATELDKRIGQELRKSQGRVKTMDQAEQSAIALNVILEQVGADVLEHRASELLLPYENVLPNAERGTLSKDIQFAGTSLATRLFGGTTLRRVTINPAHRFWRKDKPADATALRDQIVGKPLAQTGITIDGAPGTEVLDVPTAQLIVGISGAPVQWETVDLTRTYPVCNGITNGTSWSVNLNALMREKGTIALGLDGTTLGAANQAELVFALEQDRALWNRMVPALAGQAPTDLGIPATLTPPTPGRKWSDIVAEAVFVRLGKTPAQRAATTNVELHKVKEDVLVKGEAFDRLRDGAYNRTGAVIAMAMLADRPDIATEFSAVSKATAEAEKKRLQGRKAARTEADKLGALTLPFAFKYLNQQELKDDMVLLTADRAGVGVPTYTAWSSDAARGDALIKAATPDAVTGAANIAKIQKRIDDVMAELKKEDARMDTLANAIKKLRANFDANGVAYGTKLTDYFLSPTTIDIRTIHGGRSPQDIADEIAADCTPPLEKLDALDALIKDEDDKIKKADDKNDLKGDTLQHAVFKKYCQEQGITNPDETANYIAARSFLDDEVQRSINGMLDERFDESEGKDRSFSSPFYWEVINTVAKASGVMVVEKPSNWVGRTFNSAHYYKDPDWAGASYEGLVSAYHSLRRLHDGQEGPYFNVGSSNDVKRQMKIIARLISTKFGMDYYTATYGNLKADEVKKLKAKPQRVTTGVIEKLLNGDPPAGYEARIAHVISTTKSKVHPKRRAVVGATKWPFKKGWDLAWRNETWSLKNAAMKTGSGLKTAAVESYNYGWKHKLKIATLGTLAVASGGVLAPALFAAAYAASGGDEAPKS